MTQRRAGAPPAKGRPSPKSSSWPILLGLALGLFLVSFYVGLNGLPRRGSAPAPRQTAPPPIAPAPPVENRQRVSVRELPVEERSTRDRPSRRKERSSRSRAADAAPSPPAVALPIGTARVQEDAPPPEAAPTNHEQTSTGSGESSAEPPPASAPSAAPPSPPVPPPGGYKVQTGAFQEEENARRMADRLAASGYQPSVTTSKNADGTLFRVQVGPFPHRKAAEDAVRDLGQQGIPARVGDE